MNDEKLNHHLAPNVESVPKKVKQNEDNDVIELLGGYSSDQEE
jgi:hypothetical protein